MIPVILETPYAGNVPLHLRYLRACMRDCLLRGEAPFASHHLYTAPGVLRDEIGEERDLGIRAGFAWRHLAQSSREAGTLTVFYEDFGFSNGMRLGMEECIRHHYRCERRLLGANWLEEQLEREKAGDALEHWIKSMSMGAAA